ncbi:hypothetical protein [Desulfoscipio gibsoniae]|uniref:MoaD family protein n=1 Tax=Desulfoscipio gibsoniae DSM 7213 TaxID=767817 RepID=R4KMR9_9FIRM|nr:hypothetical protein [Desulfoscipio gibsoniae]AGL00926.1 hypothetical protein Desgi_1428 [Desulfoscipio gibsoniae DSM 7213]
MAIYVKFMSYLSNITGTSEYHIKNPCKTMEDVMEHLMDQFPDLREELFDEFGDIGYIYQIILNGRRILWPGEKEISVLPGDEILFLAFLGGG